MHFSTPFFAAIAAFLAVGVQANPVASPEADITARTTFSGNGQTNFLVLPLTGTMARVMSPFKTPTTSSPYLRRTGTPACTAGSRSPSPVDNGNSVDVTVGDLCPGCATDDIELTPAAFSVLAPLDVGVILVEWYFK
ncbi:Riboflavin-aldehyde forming enzyme [Mycena sanguinolenta]|uniref:Riboflavin-aldehyde forming enzyme n=1 Tax=Mycena sanguinolenta TaxID=230812 RepID=A0A8H6XX41_9AGAR|nr:Riboflavin-aldehyde forming enzyme [Mycena sanguinolenta]